SGNSRVEAVFTVSTVTISSDYSHTFSLDSNITVTNAMEMDAGTFNQNISTLTAGSFTMTGGQFNGGTQPININGRFVLIGGTFTATSGYTNLAGNYGTAFALSSTTIFAQTGGVFWHNHGTVVFNWTSQGCYDQFWIDVATTTLYNATF